LFLTFWTVRKPCRKDTPAPIGLSRRRYAASQTVCRTTSRWPAKTVHPKVMPARNNGMAGKFTAEDEVGVEDERFLDH